MLRQLLLIIVCLSIGMFVLPAAIQAQGFGSDPNNYYCADKYGAGELVRQDGFKCIYNLVVDGQTQTFTRNAIIKPPPLKIAQIWFVRVIYVLWGVAGVVFTFLLISIGAQYMLSFGNDKAVGDVIRRFQRWIVGLALIFLSYPILATVFNLLPISKGACYADISIPGFQFFFPEACVNLTCQEICEETYVGSGVERAQCLSACSTP
jgi:hypothetical protein